MEAFERAQRLPSLMGLRSAWRAELSPRANRGKDSSRSGKRATDNLEIEVVDVSAHLVETLLREKADNSDMAGADCGDPEMKELPNVDTVRGDEFPFQLDNLHRPATEKLPDALDPPQLNERFDESTAEVQGLCSGTGLNMQDRPDGVARENPKITQKGAEFVDSAVGEFFQAAATGHSQAHSRGLSQQRTSSAGGALAKRERSPARVSPHRRPNAGHVTDPGSRPLADGAKQPVYRSKTPPRIDCSFKIGSDKPLSPTLSLPSITNGFCHSHSSRVHPSNSEGHSLKQHVVDMPPAYGGHAANGGRYENGRPCISNGYVSENGQVCHLLARTA
jgi:hypothetical protein